MFDSPLSIALVGVLGLFGVGLYGLLLTRNLIKVVVALQILVKGAVLALVVAGNVSGKLQISQSLAITVIVADTIVAVVALALVMQVKQRVGTLDVRALSELRK
ncbi:MAG: NADH-quinone oxidoreductase subunit K [Anaerolineae bacterium]|nr:NADH-quinone oxidoreductase subunit K [Anaerolineae bacterium]